MKKTKISVSETIKKLLRKCQNYSQSGVLIMQNRKKPELLEEACKPVEGINAKTVIEDLIRERKMELAKEET